MISNQKYHSLDGIHRNAAVQYLIGMSKSHRAVHIYRFKGSGGPPDERPTDSLRFKDFFKLAHETVVLKESEALSKDFCLVTANGRFVSEDFVPPFQQ